MVEWYPISSRSYSSRPSPAILPYILRIPISWGYRPIFQICSGFSLKIWPYITLKQRPILLKIWHWASKTPHMSAGLSGSPASHSPAHGPQQSRVPKSRLTAQSKFLLGWSHLALPRSKKPLHWHLFPEQATGSRSLWRVSPHEDPVDLSQCLLCHSSVTWKCLFRDRSSPDNNTWFCRTSSQQLLAFLAMAVAFSSQQMGRSRMTEILNKGRMFLTLRKQSFPSPTPVILRSWWILLAESAYLQHARFQPQWWDANLLVS